MRCVRIIRLLKPKYLIWQLERGTENKRLHMQGLIILPNSQRHSYLRKRMVNAHIERCGDVDFSIEYCQKSDTREKGYSPIVMGVPPKGKGHRSDLKRITDLISEGATIRDIYLSVPASTLLHIRNIETMRRYVTTPKNVRKFVFILWGETGTGKTRLVREYFKDELYISPPNSGTNNIFFDMFDQCQHRAVLVDDYYGYWKWSAMLQVCDRYSIYVQTRNSLPCLFFPEFLIELFLKSFYLNIPNAY